MNKKIIPLFVLLVLVISSGVTYAYYSWTSTNTGITFNIAGATVTYNATGNLAKNLIPTASRTNSNNISRTITVSSTQSMTFNLYLDLTTLPDALTESCFKWEIYNGSTKLNYGDFSNSVAGDTITLLTSTINSTSVSYTLYIWIDGNMSNPSTITGQTFLFNLRAGATDEPSDLPSGYTEVEYLQSSGIQYIDTGFTPNQDTSVEIDAQYLDSLTGSLFFGDRTSTSSGYSISAYTGTTWGGNYGTTNTSGSISTDFNRHVFLKSKNILYVDNNVSVTYTTQSFICSGTALLFACKPNPGTVPAKLRIFYCKIWNDSTLVRNFIPAIRNSDYAVGMYDTVNNVFYANAGSGTFSYG